MTDHADTIRRSYVDAPWLAAMLATYSEQDSALTESNAVIVRMPGDPLTFVVLQRNGEHLMVQVNRAELVIA